MTMARNACNVVTPRFDFSDISFPRTLKEFPSSEIGIKVTLGVLVELVVLVGNILVITIVIRVKSMRTTTNYYLVNLAVSDLLVAVMPIWIHVVSSLNEFWIFGSFLCKFNPFMQITSMCASMFTLLVLAGDRFFAIMYPIKSRVTRLRVWVMLSSVWILAMGIATPLLFVLSHTERKWKDVHEMFCDEVWPTKVLSYGSCDNGLTSKKIYWIIVCAVLNWAPLLLMTVAYSFIVIKLCQHKSVPKLGASSHSSIQERSKKRVVIMLFSVLIAFIVCVVPFQTLRIYFLFTVETDGSYKLPDWYLVLDFGAVLLLYTNGAINPIIYAGLSESFRKGFKDLINGMVNRKAANASTKFESANTQRSALPALGSRVALVEAGESSTPFDDSVFDFDVPVVESGLSNRATSSYMYSYGTGNPFGDKRLEGNASDTSNSYDIPGLGDVFVTEPAIYTFKF